MCHINSLSLLPISVIIKYLVLVTYRCHLKLLSLVVYQCHLRSFLLVTYFCHLKPLTLIPNQCHLKSLLLVMYTRANKSLYLWVSGGSRGGKSGHGPPIEIINGVWPPSGTERVMIALWICRNVRILPSPVSMSATDLAPYGKIPH